MDALLAKRMEPIALLVSAPEGKVLEYAVAIDESTIYIVRDSKIGGWLKDESLPKYMHGAKEIARVIPIAGLVFDTELAAYLINPGGRNLEL